MSQHRSRNKSHSLSRRPVLGAAGRWLGTWAVPMFFLLTLAFGGGTAVGLGRDMVLQLLSLPVLAIALFRLEIRDANGQIMWGRLAPLLIFLLPLLQIIPLPPAVWTTLPGREQVVAIYDTARIPPPWLAVSFSPHATLYALFSMLPAMAVYLSAVSTDTDGRYRLVITACVFGAISAIIGLAQLASVPEAQPTMSSAADAVYATGLFANRNHFAALIYSVLPLCMAWTLRQRPDEKRPWLFRIIGGGLMLVLLSGASISYSRAGATLSVVALIASASLLIRSSQSLLGRAIGLSVAAAIVVVAVVLQLGTVDLLMERGAVDQVRQIIRGVSLHALGDFAILGTGFGTFVPIYMSYETTVDILLPNFINHVHNDWIELAIEGGVPAVVALVLFVVWFARRVWLVLFAPGKNSSPGDTMLAKASIITISLLLVHSLVDYQLRTTTLMALFGLCCAILTAVPVIAAAAAGAGGMTASSLRDRTARNH